jgi:CspA family cold shock protein
MNALHLCQGFSASYRPLEELATPLAVCQENRVQSAGKWPMIDLFKARTQTKERLLMEGHIKWYDEKKRFGFVTTQENEDIFLHVSGIKEYGHFGLQRDDRVEFEIRETAKGKQAVNLRPAK